MQPSAEQARPWNEVWTQAVFQPSVTTFQTLLSDPGATRNRAYAWIVRAAWLGGVLAALGTALSVNPTGQFGEVCFSPIVTALVSVLIFALFTAILQWIARALGGTGTYSQLVYLSASFQAPLSIVVGLGAFLGGVAWLPNLVALAVGLYGLVLTVIALRAVNQFSWSRAVLAQALFTSAGILLAAGVIFVSLLLSIDFTQPFAPGAP